MPVLVGVYVWMQQRRQVYAVRFTNLALLHQVVGRSPGVRRHVPPVLFLLGMLALLFSLARPTLVLAVPRASTDVMLVLDVSGSMGATDLQPTRLDAATSAARTFLDSLPEGARVGVVSFSQGANVVAPLSSDKTQAENALNRLRPSGGTAIGTVLILVFLPALYAIWFRVNPLPAGNPDLPEEPAGRETAPSTGPSLATSAVSHYGAQ